MKKFKHKSILNKERFRFLEEERINYLRKLTFEKCKKIMNEFFSKGFYRELKQYIIEDTPLSLKKSLKRR
jgi:hypothetical protein